MIAGCRVNKKENRYIVALVKPTRGPYLKNISKAWEIDVNTNSFVSIPIKGIDCINDEEVAD